MVPEHLPDLPEGVLLGGHGPELVEDLRAGRALLGEAAVDGEAVRRRGRCSWC